MLDYWLDPLFLEMFLDRFLRGTAMVWQAVWQPALWLLAGLLGSLMWARRPAHAHRFLLLACLAAVLTPLLSVVVDRMNWGIFHRSAAALPYVLLAPDDREGSDASVAVRQGASTALARNAATKESPAALPSAAFVPAKVIRPVSVSSALLWAW